MSDLNLRAACIHGRYEPHTLARDYNHNATEECPGGREVTDDDILAMAAALEPFQCGGCDEFTAVSHWRSGADGAMFHAGADAPPSDPSLRVKQPVAVFAAAFWIVLVVGAAWFWWFM